jgi:hypothetical protein
VPLTNAVIGRVCTTRHSPSSPSFDAPRTRDARTPALGRARMRPACHPARRAHNARLDAHSSEELEFGMRPTRDLEICQRRVAIVGRKKERRGRRMSVARVLRSGDGA